MTIEEKLRDYILGKYKSIRSFALVCGIPYTTLMSILKRGIIRASIDTVISICDCLEIDVNHLAKNEIVELETLISAESEFLKKYSLLNVKGKARIELYLDDLLASSKNVKE